MTTLSISMTEAEVFALSTIAINPQEWADNVLTDRARVALVEIKSQPAWGTLLQRAAAAGNVALDDDWALLLFGKTSGLIKTASQLAAEEATRDAASNRVSDYVSAVNAEALKRKMVVVNQYRDDKLPITQEGFVEGNNYYQQQVTKISAKKTLGQTLTMEEKVYLQRIMTGAELIENIDLACLTIKGAPNYEVAPENDSRWPQA